jgi:hypothetical protein
MNRKSIQITKVNNKNIKDLAIKFNVSQTVIINFAISFLVKNINKKAVNLNDLLGVAINDLIDFPND